MIRELLENDRGEYPWQTVRWGFGTAFMAGIPFAFFAVDGELRLAVGAGALGFAFLVFMALLAWRWSI